MSNFGGVVTSGFFSAVNYDMVVLILTHFAPPPPSLFSPSSKIHQKKKKTERMQILFIVNLIPFSRFQNTINTKSTIKTEISETL